MTLIKRSISFIIEGKTDLRRLRCVVVWNGNRVRLNVGIVVTAIYWESALQRCRAKTFHGKAKVPASAVNRRIDEFEALVETAFTTFEEMDVLPTKEQLKEQLATATSLAETTDKDTHEDNIKSDDSLFPVFDAYIEDCVRSGRWSHSAYQKYRTIRNHLFKMSPRLTFEELSEGGMTDFIAYLSSIPDKENRVGLSNPTNSKNIGCVKAFVRWAQNNGYTENNKFLSQRPRLRTSRKTVIFLNWDELMTVYNYDFGSKNYLAQARDVFCFCCFTSLRYSDVANLKRSNFGDDSFTFTTVKTNDRLTIELNKFSKHILSKYAHVRFPKDKVLPVISNQRMNDYIKEIGEICGINEPVTVSIYKGARRIDETHPKWELLSTHAARRTFVCNALMLGIPPTIVMKWTGHSDYRAMKPYIDVVDDATKKAMSVFNNVC